jgi:hypothetical protein
MTQTRILVPHANLCAVPDNQRPNGRATAIRSLARHKPGPPQAGAATRGRSLIQASTTLAGLCPTRRSEGHHLPLQHPIDI